MRKSLGGNTRCHRMSRDRLLAGLLVVIALGCAPAATSGSHPLSSTGERLDRLIEALDGPRRVQGYRRSDLRL
jgi:hypothetical protein